MSDSRLDRLPEWRSLRRHDVVAFIHQMAKRHPELARTVVWDGFVRMAERDGIRVRTLPSRGLRACCATVTTCASSSTGA